MGHNKNITDRDLFNYVFKPDSLSGEERSRIASDERFNASIQFYEALKTSLENELPDQVKEKIAKRIKLYKEVTSFYLYPVEGEPVAGDGGVVKYIDRGNNYLAVIRLAEGGISITLEPLKRDKSENFTIELAPSGTKIVCPSAEQSISAPDKELPQYLIVSLQ